MEINSEIELPEHQIEDVFQDNCTKTYNTTGEKLHSKLCPIGHAYVQSCLLIIFLKSTNQLTVLLPEC